MPSRLSENLTKVLPGNICDSIDDFGARRARFKKNSNLPKLGLSPIQKRCLDTSYIIFAQQKKATHNRWNIARPCALYIVCVVRIKQRKLKLFSYQSRIVEMSSNAWKQHIVEESPFPFNMQTNESSLCPSTVCPLRTLNFLFCGSLLRTTKASDVF